MVRKSIIPAAAKDSAPFPALPEELQAQAWLVWMLSPGPERCFQNKSALTFSSELAHGRLLDTESVLAFPPGFLCVLFYATTAKASLVL